MTPVQMMEPTADLVALEKRFRELEATLMEEPWFRSDPQAYINHPAFRAIVAMGPAIVPYILADLERRPKEVLWVWALPEITGQDVKPEGEVSESMMRKLGRAWLRWGSESGLKW